MKVISQAVFPIIEIRKLWIYLLVGSNSVNGSDGADLFVSGVSILVSIYNSMNERRSEIGYYALEQDEELFSNALRIYAAFIHGRNSGFFQWSCFDCNV